MDCIHAVEHQQDLRLDAIGAIGVARCLTFGGAFGRQLHDPDIQPREYLTKEAYLAQPSTTINHFYEKLLRLKVCLHLSQSTLASSCLVPSSPFAASIEEGLDNCVSLGCTRLRLYTMPGCQNVMQHETQQSGNRSLVKVVMMKARLEQIAGHDEHKVWEEDCGEATCVYGGVSKAVSLGVGRQGVKFARHVA